MPYNIFHDESEKVSENGFIANCIIKYIFVE